VIARHKFKRHKYGAKPTEVDGIKFGSKREAAYYSELKLRQRAGEVIGFLMQVPLRLTGGVIYRMDFLEFLTDGTCKGVEVKGFETATWKLKKRMVDELYPWLELEVVK